MFMTAKNPYIAISTYYDRDRLLDEVVVMDVIRSIPYQEISIEIPNMFSNDLIRILNRYKDEYPELDEWIKRIESEEKS